MSAVIQVGELIAGARRKLEGHSETHVLDVQLLLAHALGKNRTWILAHPDAGVAPEAARVFEALLARRLEGDPLPYILGRWEFYGLSFLLTPDVLIPRPETEQLVDLTVRRARSLDQPARIADVGTGSGCIAISVATTCPDAAVFALEVSPLALAVARQNGQDHAVSNVEWISSDLFANLPDRARPLDIICANLPYIPTQTWRNLAVARHEPRLALDGGADGLRLIEELLDQAVGKVAPRALILLEIEATTELDAEIIAKRHYPDARIDVLPDFAGHPRILRIEMP